MATFVTKSLAQVVPLASGRDRIFVIFFSIEVELIYNELVSGVQHSGSVTHIYVWILFHSLS